MFECIITQSAISLKLHDEIHEHMKIILFVFWLIQRIMGIGGDNDAINSIFSRGNSYELAR